MKAIKFIGIAALAVFVITGCKPTEKNYETAYAKASEAARLKAEDAASSIDGNKLEKLDGPRIEKVGEDSIAVGTGRLKPFESDKKQEGGNYGVAIARYSMPTNARRHLEDVRKEFPDAFIATDGHDNYYVMIKRVATIPESADPIKLFRLKHPDYNYMGLGGVPTVYFVTL